MKIELQETLERFVKSGVNLFIGAGFSIYSKDNEGNNLPLGSQLTRELIKKFNCPDIQDLSKVCTIIDSYNSESLNNYLINRFKVVQYDVNYNNLLKINCPRIFTTNIDNLPSMIFKSTNEKYLNNVFENGLVYQDKRGVDYIPIHGCVDVPETKFLFNKQEISGSYRTEISAWMSLNNAANQLPSIFLGYSLEDVGAIESIFGAKGGTTTQKDKWILLHKDDPGNEAYFRALGFKIMIGDIKEFLLFVNNIQFNTIALDVNKDNILEIYPEACVPENNSNLRIRQIDEFFIGSAPIWSDIISNRVYKTHHLDIIANLVERDKHIIVTGIPASGKSTLLLQLAKKLNSSRRVLHFQDVSLSKSEIIKNEISVPTVVLIDNFTSNIESFINISKNKSIKIIGFDRYYNIDISTHKLPSSIFDRYDISDLNPEDIQGIYNTIPLTIRKSRMTVKQLQDETPSVFEFVNYNIDKPDLSNRYKNILVELNDSNQILLELLIMTCYVHSCRVPVSFEVVNSFLYDDISDYKQVLSTMKALKGLIYETIGDIIDDADTNQDYYQPRSQILAETIITQTKSEYFKRVFEKFHNNVPKYLIPNFYIFKRNAYDASYVSKAYSYWEEGLLFYENAYQTDRNPFLLQQCSLYLLKKKRYIEAALKIDEALQISNKRFFSIENTHAIVLFKANINANDSDHRIKTTLDRSMTILKNCYFDDQRKSYHAFTFAEQALEYFERYPDFNALEYLKMANEWLLEIPKDKRYSSRVKKMMAKIAPLI